MTIQPSGKKPVTNNSMNIPEGYKRTDNGVIPENWEIKSLSDLCLPQGLVRGPFGGTLKKESFVDSGFKVYEQRNAIYKNCKRRDTTYFSILLLIQKIFAWSPTCLL